MITPSFSITATERVLPRLALDFTTGTLDPRVTVTRALNTATRVNSSGFIESINADLPRFDYDPLTLSPKGLLIEETRINSALQSETFTTTWANFGYGLDKNYAAPDNQNTATKIVPDNATTLANNALQQNVSKAASALAYTFSIFAKAGEFNRLRLLVRDVATGNNFARATFNLGTKTVSDGPTAGGTFTAASVSYQDAANGYIRYCLTFTTGTETSIRPVLVVFDSVATTGNGTSGVYAWGAQLETGAFATSYIPTTTTSLTRNADAVSMTGTNFSDWYNAAEGTFMLQSTTPPNWGTASTALTISDGTLTNYMRMMAYASGSVMAAVINNSSSQANLTRAITASTNYKTAFAYKENSFAATFSGQAPSTDPTGTIPTVNSMQIGSWSNGSGQAQRWIQNIYYWPQRLLNAELQAITN